MKTFRVTITPENDQGDIMWPAESREALENEIEDLLKHGGIEDVVSIRWNVVM